jgi:hypothetical protein
MSEKLEKLRNMVKNKKEVDKIEEQKYWRTKKNTDRVGRKCGR